MAKSEKQKREDAEIAEGSSALHEDSDFLPIALGHWEELPSEERDRIRAWVAKNVHDVIHHLVEFSKGERVIGSQIEMDEEWSDILATMQYQKESYAKMAACFVANAERLGLDAETVQKLKPESWSAAPGTAAPSFTQDQGPG